MKMLMEDIDRADHFVELALHECGREICIPEKAIVFSTKSYHLFHYVIQGKGNFEMGGKHYHVHKGELFYIPPNCDAKYAPDHDDPWTYEWLGFSGVSCDAFLARIGLSRENPVLTDISDNNIKRYFDEIVNEFSEKGYLDVASLGLAYQLFGTLSNRVRERSTGNYSQLSSHIENAQEFIRNNFQFQIKVDDIAKNVGVTPNYLANIFTKSTGLSPKQYLIKVRMEKASVFLKTSDYKIKEIAMMVGYRNQLHFSSEFKKYCGVSPLQYQKKEKKS